MSSASTGGGTEGSSPASSPASAASQAMAAPKYGTLVPNRIFVGGISANTSEGELAQLFSSYGNVKATKIILDRAGVSKGYGFVTFETEEEAKRLQQESECIILRERKLNIAPAIKKQPFSRSFDGGSGSPPTVPTSPYYYANGMGLPYQNGLTFYNAGAPAPGAPLAPPTDPAALYQAAGVFGPQAASAHQTFAPMMYPCPAPSLYMPQQYQYSPMPYESYYTGAAGASPYIYTAASSGTTNGTTVGTNGNQNTGGGTGATSPPTNHHFYPGAGGPPNCPPNHHHHHHPQTLPSGPTTNHQGLDQVYYSFTAAPPPHSHQHQAQAGQGPPTQHGNIGLGDQQLLLYTTDCQQPVNSDSQTAQQEETRSTPSHSQNDVSHHQQSQTTTLEQPPTSSHSNSTNPPTTPLMSLVPLKYPITPRYTNYTHPLSLHHSAMTPTSPTAAVTSYQTDSEDATTPPMHCRTILYTPVFIQTPYTTPSLLPTPSNPPNHQSNPQKSPYNTTTRVQNGYSIFSNIHQTHYPKSHQQQQASAKIIQNQRRNSASSSYVITRGFDRPSTLSNSSGRSTQASFTSSKSNMEMNSNSTRRNMKNGNFGLKNVTGTTNMGPGDDGNGSDKPTTSPPPAPYSPMTRPLPNFSPTNLQVQFYSSRGHYHQGTAAPVGQSPSLQNSSQPSIQQQRRFSSIPQQQQHNNSSQIHLSGRKISDKFGTSAGVQGLVVRNNKYKVNGLSSKVLDEGIGGAGDAQGARIQMTPPPGTPRNTQDNQITETCHQMQTLTL